MALGDNKLSIWVGLRAEQFQKGIKKVQSGFKTLNRTIGAFSTAFVGQQIFQLGKQFADAAGEMENVERSFSRSFAGISSSVETELGKLADSLNRNETQLKKGAVSFNAFFSGLGFVSKEAANMSVKMQTLSLDLASFFGIADSNAQKRFLSALAGSPEVLDQFGINLKQSALQLELYRMGLKSTVQNTNEVIKTQARLNIIMRSMTDAGILGDATRGLDTYQGQIKQLEGEFINFSESIGEYFIPAVTKAVKIINKLLEGAQKFFGSSDAEIQEEADAVLDKVNKAFGKDDVIQKKIELTTVTKENQEDKKNVGLRSELENVEDQRLRILDEKQLEELASLTLRLDEINSLIEQANLFEEDTKSLRVASNILGDDKAKIEKIISDQLKEEKKVRDQFLMDQKNYLKLKEDESKLNEEFVKNAKLSVPQLEKLLELEKAKLRLAENQKELTGQSDEDVAVLEKRVAAISELTRRLQEVPAKLLKGSVDISSKEVDLKTGHVMSDAESKDNIGVLLGLGTSAQQEKNFNELMAEKSKMIAKSLTTSKEELGKGTAKVKEDLLHWIDVLRPITDAVAQIWSQILTPPDNTIGKDEQKERTKAAFAGIMIGLGQAMVSLGTGALLLNKGMQSLGTGNIGPALLMIAGGSALIALGKGQLQKVKNKAHAREQATGGGANRSGAKGGFSAMLEAIQGEQVFRLAGNDLVTSINRTNRFQGTIGG